MNRTLLIVDMQNDYFPGGKMDLVGIKEASENFGLCWQCFAKEMPIPCGRRLNVLITREN